MVPRILRSWVEILRSILIKRVPDLYFRSLCLKVNAKEMSVSLVGITAHILLKSKVRTYNSRSKQKNNVHVYLGGTSILKNTWCATALPPTPPLDF